MSSLYYDDKIGYLNGPGSTFLSMDRMARVGKLPLILRALSRLG